MRWIEHAITAAVAIYSSGVFINNDWQWLAHNSKRDIFMFVLVMTCIFLFIHAIINLIKGRDICD